MTWLDELKIGKLVFDRGEPLKFVEADSSEAPSPSQSQREALKQIGDTLKAYLKAADQLLDDKYPHLRDITPSYLSNRGNVAVVLCADGVVIRYDSPSQPRHLFAGAAPEGFAEAALQISQHLVRCYVENPQPLDESKAVTLRFSIINPASGQSRELVGGYVTFNAQVPREIKEPLPLQKPFCLLSVLNRLEIELHGELESLDHTPDSKFVARSVVRLPVGWECFEVFPGFQPNRWNPEHASAWAENDILAWAVAHQHREAQYNALDPRAAVRRRFAKLLGDFKLLLDSNPEREQELHTFLELHPYLICPTQTKTWSKLALGAHVTDFVFRDAANNYLLVELEKSTDRLFRRDRSPTAKLVHATSQIVDWKRYLQDNLATVQRELGLPGISANSSGLVVIGRSATLPEQERRKLQVMNGNSPTLQIATYDDVFMNAKAVCENLLGPMWDVGGNTEIYYLS